MSTINDLEKSLNEIFVDSAPALPSSTKKLILECLPWVSLILGSLTLLSAYNIWKWAHLVNGYANYVNSLSQFYGGPILPTDHMSLAVWLSIVILALEAVLYITAFSYIAVRRKGGWNLLFYSLLANLIYGVTLTFTEYGGFGQLFVNVIASVIGLYFIFQIRKEYMLRTKKPSPILEK